MFPYSKAAGCFFLFGCVHLIPEVEAIPVLWAEVVVVLVELTDLRHVALVELPRADLEVLPELVLLEREGNSCDAALGGPLEADGRDALAMLVANLLECLVLEHSGLVGAGECAVAQGRVGLELDLVLLAVAKSEVVQKTIRDGWRRERTIRQMGWRSS